MVLIAPMVIASPAGTWSMASPTASGATTAMVLRSATRNGTSRGLRSIRERSTGRFLAGVRALSAIRSALLLLLQERLKPLLQGRGLRIAGGSGVRELVLRRCRVQVLALLAGAVFARGVEAFEHRREVLLDVIQEEVLLVQLVVALFAEPHQAVVLVRQALAFDDQADRVGHALRRVRHRSEEEEYLAGADRDVARRPVLLDAKHHLTLELVEPHRAFIPVVKIGRASGRARRWRNGLDW